MQAAFHLASSLGLLLFYWPPKTEYPKLSVKDFIWAIDPIGSFLFVTSATLMLLALNWVGGAFEWSDIQVAVPLAIGLALFVAFCLYGESMKSRRLTGTEWNGLGIMPAMMLINPCHDKLQNGKDEMTDWSHMFSSPGTPTSPCPCSLSL
jgi:hypothetical protein